MLCNQFGWNRASDSGMKQFLNVNIVFNIFTIFSSGNRAWTSFEFIKTAPSQSSKLLFDKCGWNWSCGSKEWVFTCCYFAIFFLGVRLFIWRNEALLWGKNYPSFVEISRVVLEKRSFKVDDAFFLLFSLRSLQEEGFTNLNPLRQKMLFVIWDWNWCFHVVLEMSFKCCVCILLYHNYLPMEKDMVHQSNDLESLAPKVALWQV